VLVEHALNLAGIRDAAHAEYGPGGTPVITLLECSLLDQTITVDVATGSLLERLYGARRVVEHTTCSYGLAPEVQHIANDHGMRLQPLTRRAKSAPLSGSTIHFLWAPSTSRSCGPRPAHHTRYSPACSMP